MGLDIYIHKMKPMDASKVWTEREVNALGDDCELHGIKPVKGNEDFSIEGADGYLFKCSREMYDVDEMMRRLGISEKNGWMCNGDGSSPQYTPEKKQPPEDEVEWWFDFVNKHNSEEYKDWEHVEYPVPLGAEGLVKMEEWWCIVTVGNELADMRKGANERFYDDGLWDENFCPVCSKRVLAEHMEKYFDDGPGYVYENCREVFRNIIFDKFEDGRGLCVVYA